MILRNSHSLFVKVVVGVNYIHGVIVVQEQVSYK